MSSSTNSLGNSASARYLLFLSVALCIITSTIGIAFWAAMKYHDTKFLVVILALQILASSVVGALAATIHTCLAKRVEDSETADSDSVSIDDGDSNSSRRSDTPSPPDGTRSAQTGSLRNFSLPRERCLDVAPPVSTRATPVLPQYIATGITSSPEHVARPLSTSPLREKDGQKPSSPGQQIEDFIFQPLDIRKIQKRKSQTLFKLANQEHRSEPPTMDLSVEAGSKISFFPDITTDEDKTIITDNSLSSNVGPEIGTEAADLETPASPFDVDYATNTGSAITCFSPSAVDEHKSSIATGAAVPTSQDAVFGPTESKVLPLYKTVSPSEVPQAPRHSATSAIPIEESTPVIPPVVDTSSLSPTKLATIRLVDSFLEMPQEVDHASLVRKWKGQRSFISF